jgi:predicted kinase
LSALPSIGMSRGEVWRHRWITVGRKIAIVRGLPGVGKTTLAARLAHDWGVLRAARPVARSPMAPSSGTRKTSVSGDEFHDEEQNAALLADLEDLADEGMVQRGGGDCFAV